MRPWHNEQMETEGIATAMRAAQEASKPKYNLASLGTELVAKNALASFGQAMETSVAKYDLTSGIATAMRAAQEASKPKYDMTSGIATAMRAAQEESKPKGGMSGGEWCLGIRPAYGYCSDALLEPAASASDARATDLDAAECSCLVHRMTPVERLASLGAVTLLFFFMTLLASNEAARNGLSATASLVGVCGGIVGIVAYFEKQR